MMKILLVDDDPDILLIASMALEKTAGHEVVTAELGAEALQRVKQDPPDLILLDYMMVDMDGPTLLGRLRAEKGVEEIPVIFLTAKADPAVMERLLALGVRGVIGKPFDPMILAAEVDRLLGA